MNQLLHLLFIITIFFFILVIFISLMVTPRHMRTHSRYSMGDTAALVEAAQREAALKLEPMEVQ